MYSDYGDCSRDIYLWLGYIDASAGTAHKALDNGIPSLGFICAFYLKRIQCLGYSLVVLPGGEQEMIIAKPGDHSVVLRNRMGFVRLAIQK